MALSYVQYQGNGSQETYAIPFPYLDRSHIEVRVALDVHAFTWDDPNTIRITPAPADGAVIEARRVTPRDTRMVDFVDGSVLTEGDLDLATIQTFYIVQEAIDIAGGTLELLADGSYGAGGRRIKNVGSPIEARDAVTKEYHDGTFLPQMNNLLNLATAARDGAVTARGVAEASLAAAVAARDLALQYRDTTKDYRDEVATWNANVNAKSANVDTKSANVDAKAATVDTQAGQVAADRTATQGFRNEAEGFKNAAAASAAAAALFDPSSYYTKAQVYTKSEVDGQVTALGTTVSTVDANANSRVSKGGDMMTGPLEINLGVPHLWLHYPGIKRARWVVDGDGALIWQDQGGQYHIRIGADGAVWTQQLGSLSGWIESRADAWSATRRDEANNYAASLHNAQQADVNARVAECRMAGYGEFDGRGAMTNVSPGVVTGASGSPYGAAIFGYRTLQFYRPDIGWANFGVV